MMNVPSNIYSLAVTVNSYSRKSIINAKSAFIRLCNGKNKNETTTRRKLFVNYELPQGVKAVVTDQTKLELTGADKQLLGQVAAEIRSYRKPEPYKGKGVKYAEETILRKEGKKK